MKLILSVLMTLTLTSCVWFVTWEDLSESWMGGRIGDFIKGNGKPTSVSKNSDGTSSYRFDFPENGPKCIHYWTVKPNGIIVGARNTGSCYPIG